MNRYNDDKSINRPNDQGFGQPESNSSRPRRPFASRWDGDDADQPKRPNGVASPGSMWDEADCFDSPAPTSPRTYDLSSDLDDDEAWPAGTHLARGVRDDSADDDSDDRVSFKSPAYQGESEPDMRPMHAPTFQAFKPALPAASKSLELSVSAMSLGIVEMPNQAAKPARRSKAKSSKAKASKARASKPRASSRRTTRRKPAKSGRAKPMAGRGKTRSRRAVASVLAMMFLVIFGSLAAAMAVVAQSNLRTADSGLKLSRAMSAAETGMVFAQNRLQQQAARFVVEKGVIDEDFAADIWMGTYDTGADGAVTVLDPVGYTETTPPSGVVHALYNAHEHDDSLSPSHSIIVDPPDGNLPAIDLDTGELRVKPIAVNANPDSPYFRLTYELMDADERYVRVTSLGVDGDISRELRMLFKIEKKIEFAILSPNRIMIGKNVLVEGPLGSRYGLGIGELDSANGDPLVMRSDFYYLADALNTKLDTLYAEIIDHDVDGDSRLRPDHTLENLGLSGQPDLIDYNGDEYVDDFDLFLKHYDSSGDKAVVYDAVLADAANHGAMSVEYGAGANDDLQLMRLVDQANPDRDADGVPRTLSDTGLGYNDGIIDINDLYAKVRGNVGFSISQDSWETPNGGPYQGIVQGPVRPDLEVAPVIFEASDEQMREITTAMFNESQSWFDANADGDFAGQLSGGTTTMPSDATWEPVPFGAQGAYDYYKRTVYDGYTFNNVRIPKGTNAVFKNCTFIGVTFVDTQANCGDYNWNYAGAVEKKTTEVPLGSGNFVVSYPLKFPDIVADMGGTPVADTRVESNNLRFDNCTFLGSIAGAKPDEYTHWRNKVQMTGTTRFYVDPWDLDLMEQDDAAELQAALLSLSDDARAELSKSSILMPGWSVDVGNFNNEQATDPEDTPVVKLKGTIIAGILDVRGTADVHGTLLMTFRPVAPGATLPDPAAGPLAYGGLPDAFNTTVGYFGPLDGDGEGEDPTSGMFQGFGEITLRYDPNANLPDGIPWPIRIEAEPETYVE